MWISKELFQKFKESSALLLAELEELRKRPYLISVERENHINKFTFFRNGKLYVIETQALISDNMPEWKKELLR